MIIIISPAKKMNVNNDIFLHKNLPKYLDCTNAVLDQLTQMAPNELQSLWKCNDSIANLNIDRLKNMDLEKNLSPAIFSYEGIQYQYMGPEVLEESNLTYLEKHLRILSGFYGILRPFDGVTPYRLEMQAKLSINDTKNLYEFWGNKLALDIEKESNLVVNLASKEYSDAIKKYLPPTMIFLTITFGELIDGKVKEKGTKCKMARGQMVRWLAENKVTQLEEIKSFSQLNYTFSPAYSSTTNYVFIENVSKL